MCFFFNKFRNSGEPDEEFSRKKEKKKFTGSGFRLGTENDPTPVSRLPDVVGSADEDEDEVVLSIIINPCKGST